MEQLVSLDYFRSSDFPAGEVRSPDSHSNQLALARRRFRSGELPYADYRAIEDEVAGDLRWDDRLFVAGVCGTALSGENLTFEIVDKVTPVECSAVDEFAFASGLTAADLQVSLPAPETILRFCSETTREIYPDPDDLVNDAQKVVDAWARELAEAGCAHIERRPQRASSRGEQLGGVSLIWTTRK